MVSNRSLPSTHKSNARKKAFLFYLNHRRTRQLWHRAIGYRINNTCKTTIFPRMILVRCHGQTEPCCELLLLRRKRLREDTFLLLLLLSPPIIVLLLQRWMRVSFWFYSFVIAVFTNRKSFNNNGIRLWWRSTANDWHKKRKRRKFFIFVINYSLCCWHFPSFCPFILSRSFFFCGW